MRLSDQFTGFDTIGNATVVLYDKGSPILATDPWIQGGAYFGSWSLSHAVPAEQMKAIRDSRWVWFSHGHPDHLNPDSIQEFLGKEILLPDHVNARIKKDLEAQGHKTKILPHKEWVQLSEKVKVLCVSDYYQDAILLMDVGGVLLVNSNDAIDRGWGPFVRRAIKQYDTSVLLSLFGYGDADMIHFYDENGSSIAPKAAQRHPVGEAIRQVVESYGVTHVIPFSPMHRYQRSDSLWANQYTTELDAYSNGFHSSRCQLLPAFVRFESQTKKFEKISPPENSAIIRSPEDFGDSWSETLTRADQKEIENYFRRIQHLKSFLDFITLRVGGKEFTIAMNEEKKFRRGLGFEVPRGSLMTAVQCQIFDDLLIGNFMKTYLHGVWPASKLYPDLTPYVARYADNAYVYDREALAKYLEEYRKLDPVESFLHLLEQKSVDIFRANVNENSSTYQIGKKAYWFLKKFRS